MQVPPPVKLKENHLLLVKCGNQEVRYYSLSEASGMVTKNQWGDSVDGIHSETLRRRYRDKPTVGKRIGRDVFFSADDMKSLGYEIEDTDTHIVIGDIVQLFPMEIN